MKKFLSLMLAMIMVMSLVTVGAGAAFTDAEEIQQKEAVALLSGLGIIGGYDDGSFNPTGSLSRGAAAKIITWMSIGTAKVEALAEKGVAEKPFEDVRLDSSYAVFVEYCKENGIVGGYDDGSFLPYADLSGHAFIKMALVALGVTDIDFTVKGWQVDAVARAEDMGLLEGIDTDEVKLNLALSRENACQIAYNALGYSAEGSGYVITAKTGAPAALVALAADETVYDSRADVMAELALLGITATYGTHYTIDKKAVDTLGVKVFNLKESEGYVEFNAANDKDLKAAETKLCGDTTKYKFASGVELLGHYVTVYSNSKTGAVYTVYDNSTTLSVVKDTTTVADINAALDADEEDATIAFAAGAVEVSNQFNVAAATTTVADLITNGDEDNEAKINCTLIITDEKITGIAQPAAKYLSEVTDIVTTAGKETITLKGLNGNAAIYNGKLDDGKAVDLVDEYADIAEEDIVVVTVIGEFFKVEKAETVTGKPTKVDGTKVTVNGVEYDVYGTDLTETGNATFSLKTETTLYLDGQGNYIASKNTTTQANTDIVYVAAKYEVPVAATTDAYGVATAAHTTYFAQVVTMDGVEKAYQIKKATYDALVVDGLYKVTEATSKTADADNKIYDADNDPETDDEDNDIWLKAKYATFGAPAAADELQVGSVSTTDLKATAIKLANGYYFADEVTFLWISGDKSDLEVTVKEGVQALTGTTTVEVVYEMADDAVTKLVSYVIIEAEFAADTVYTDDVIYVAADDTSDVQVKTYTEEGSTTVKVAYEHEVYVNGVKTKVVLNSASITAGFKKMTEIAEGVYKLEALDSKYYVEDATVDSIYKGLICIAEINNKDIDVTGVKVVDLRTGVTKVTDATKIEAGTPNYNISVVVAKDKAGSASTANTIKTIYVW